METTTKLYWLTRLDAIHDFCEVMTLISVVMLFFAVLFYFGPIEKESKQKSIKAMKIITPIAIIFGLSVTFTPTRNELIFIYAGGKTIDFIQQDSSVNKLPSQATELVAKYLDNQIEQLNKESK